jgi:hypothetical protein
MYGIEEKKILLFVALLFGLEAAQKLYISKPE